MKEYPVICSSPAGLIALYRVIESGSKAVSQFDCAALPGVKVVFNKN